MSVARIALVGCGGWGRNIATNLDALGVLSVIVDPSDAARLVAAKLGIPAMDDLAAALADPEITAVAIATPAETHFDFATRALLAGKHVYVEKPLALSTSEGRLLGERAQAAGRVLMVGHLLQYHPAYAALRGLVAQRRLGRLRHVASSRLNLGLLRIEENVMWSFSPHDISMVLGLIGGSPEAVAAIGSTFLTPGVSDIMTLHMRFPGGMTADIRASWLNPQKEQKLVAIGERAMAIFDDRAEWGDKLTIHPYRIERGEARPRAVAGEVETVSVDRGEPLRLEMAHFVECVQSGSRPRTDAAEAMGVLGVLEAGQESLRRGGEWIGA